MNQTERLKLSEKIASINRRRNKIRDAIQHLETPVGNPAGELSFRRMFVELRNDMKEANEERRKWYVKMYGLSLPELDALIIRCAERFGAALKGHEYEKKQAEFEAQKKDRDYKDLNAESLRHTRKFK